ncbi:MAG: hypothetical protein OFPII_36980 [Osedax symbiont Rs1]|nr:MAG: hypothetical protein OFPII_36980 [Osedax symbiont Rs1]
MVSANNGSVDGIADRAKGIEAKYPNLVRLNTPIISVQHVIFVNKKDQFNGVTNFEKLSTHINANNYIIGYMASSKKSIQEVVDIEQKNRYPLISIQQGFDMLKKGRLTAYLAGPGISNRQLFNEKYSNSNIVELGVFSKFPLYTYIHKKHSQHLQSLNQIFHELEQDGSLIVIRNSIE